MAQRVEVAIVFKEMLGAEDAVAYMTENGIPQPVADRVMAGMTTTRISDGAIVEYCQQDADAAPVTASALHDAQAAHTRAVVPPSLQVAALGAIPIKLQPQGRVER